MGSDLEREHCRVTWEEHQVKLHPLSGKCFVNHRLVMEPLELCQGEAEKPPIRCVSLLIPNSELLLRGLILARFSRFESMTTYIAWTESSRA